MRRPNMRWLLLVVVLALPGCSFLDQLLSDVLQKPTLTFQKVSLRNLSFVGLGLDLEWRIDNPNSFGVNLASVEYELDIDGHLLTRGESPKGIQIAPAGSSPLVLPFDVQYQEMAQSLLALYQKDQVPFTVKGHFGFNTPAGVIRIPYKKDGMLPVPKLPRVQLSGGRVTALTLGGANLEVDVRLENENAFPLPLDRLTYGLSLSGQDVASGTSNVTQLGASGTRTLKLPLRVNFLNSGAAVANAVRTGKVDVGLDGKLKAGPVEKPLKLRQQIVLRK